MLPPWKKGGSLRVIPASHPLSGVADLRRNQWPIWIGMGGRFTLEWVADLARNTQATPGNALQTSFESTANN